MRVLIEIHEGHIVRNFLENGLLERLTERGAVVMVVTPGARVPTFVKRFEREGVAFADLGLITYRPRSRVEVYDFALGKWLCARGLNRLRRWSWRYLAEPRAAREGTRENALLDQWKPDVVVSTHLSQVYGRRLIATAHRRGIPTLGNLNSWDNVWKGLWVRPEVITCWSEHNREEICTFAGYQPEQVKVIGAPAFDAYFAPDGMWTRAELCARLGLDPARPILLFATLGQFSQQIDETNPFEALLRALDQGLIPGHPQVVLRMHTWSKDIYFKHLMSHPAVTLSRFETYVPGLTWTPTRDEVILLGNLMRHADVVISPGSTISIEPAAFDTPTLVPVFNEYMPEVYESYFRQTWLNQHFGRLVKHDWVPLARTPESMVEMINRALTDRSWYREGRTHIREQILGPLDGKATERFVESLWALK